MSSYYTELFKPGLDERAFLWLVNKHGEVVVHVLNDQGEVAVGFTCDHSVDRYVENILRTVNANATVLMPVGDYPDYYYTDGARRWADVAKLLNKKSGVYRTRCKVWVSVAEWPLRYVDHRWDRSPRWAPTKLGEETDAKRAEANHAE